MERELRVPLSLGGTALLPSRYRLPLLVLDMWEGGNSNILSAYVTMVMALICVGAVLASGIGRRMGIRA